MENKIGDNKRSFAVTVASITHNYFDELYNLGGGLMSAYDLIAEMSHDFEMTHRDTNWEAVVDGWDETLHAWLEAKILQRAQERASLSGRRPPPSIINTGSLGALTTTQLARLHGSFPRLSDQDLDDMLDITNFAEL